MDYGKKEGFSYIDDVPIKISEKFWPPRKVTLPLSFNSAVFGEIFEHEYDFSLERQVLEESQKLRQDQEAIENAKVEKVGSEIEQFTKTSSLEINTAEDENINQVVQSTEESDKEIEKEPSSVNCEMLPKWQSNSILQPQPLAPSKFSEEYKSDKDLNNKAFNLSDFENDSSSPFDYMELQTINDLEELNTVFQGMNTTVPSKNSNHISSCDNASLATNDLVTADRTNIQSSSDYMISSNPSSLNLGRVGQKIPAEDRRSMFTNPFHGAYNSASLENAAYTFEPYKTVQVHPILESNCINTRTFSPFSAINGYQVNSAGSVQESSDISRRASLYTGTSSNQWSITSHSSGQLRGSKSISDLRVLPDVGSSEDVSCSKRSNTPPPQFFNKPTSSHSFLNTDNSNGESSYCRIDLKNSSATGKVTYHINSEELENFNLSSSSENKQTSVKEVSEFTDPYSELSSPERTFIDSIADMGFPRGQVSRAVKHLGIDDKKVIDHLCQVQLLEEEGYDSSESEAALHLHDYNIEDGRKYLELLNQFRDLGFDKTSVKRALIQHKNDRDKALDALLA